ncbi:MarR family winged helix-turn-helix transcriptional regulator [Balneatrix alpica]|uniref:MarR family winged helix-turn-helix transcriptional regulator n=1 Tax=Balneatrix alpica TaxID=75684 RepID=A0ABV5ZDL3_9GAMM|nr:MarR family winged helix-turn-helix transcriptional regulator [Balneatrix alpica]
MQHRLFFLLTQAQKRLYRHADRRCEQELGSSVTQLAALLYIVKQPGCLQKDLAAELDLNKSAITGLLSRMEANGLVSRQTPSDDARGQALYPTALGESKAAAVKPLIQQFNQRFSEAFSEQELALVARFLNFILEQYD